MFAKKQDDKCALLFHFKANSIFR